MTASSGVSQVLDDLPCDPDWKEFHWLGFVSTATAPVAFWIDNLAISRHD